MRVFRAFLFISLAGLAVSPSLAQGSGQGISYQGWGLRVGAADDPDQVVGGAHWDLGEFVRHLRFQPNFEVGLGDDRTVVAGTAPVHWVFEVSNTFRPYAGGGLTAAWVDRDDPEPFPGDEDDSDFEIGVKAIGGLEWALSGGNRFGLELAVHVVDDVYNAQVMAAWTFR